MDRKQRHSTLCVLIVSFRRAKVEFGTFLSTPQPGSDFICIFNMLLVLRQAMRGSKRNNVISYVPY